MSLLAAHCKHGNSYCLLCFAESKVVEYDSLEKNESPSIMKLPTGLQIAMFRDELVVLLKKFGFTYTELYANDAMEVILNRLEAGKIFRKRIERKLRRR